MAIEEIDPKTGEVTTKVDQNDEISALQAKLAALQGATAAKPQVRVDSENPNPNAEEDAAAEEAAIAAAKEAKALEAAKAKVAAAQAKADEDAKATAAASVKLSDQARVSGPAGTAVATAGAGRALVSGGTMEMDALIAQHAGRGLHFEARDLQIPRIVLLQDNSPQVKKQTMGYLPGAEAGMLMNNNTNALMTEAFMIPVHYKRRWVGWKPRDEKGGGGGLVRPDVPESEYLRCEEVSIGKRSYIDQKHGMVEIVDTPEWFVLLSNDGLFYYPVAISMQGTKAKIAGRMNTTIMSQVVTLPNGEEATPAPWSNLFMLGAKREGEGSEAYFNFSATHQGRVTSASAFLKAAQYAVQFESGELDSALTQD